MNKNYFLKILIAAYSDGMFKNENLSVEVRAGFLASVALRDPALPEDLVGLTLTELVKEIKSLL